MHELAICASLVRTLEQEARRQQFARVRTVYLELGPYAGVDTEALRFSFEVVTRGTVAEDASLDITELPAAAWCMHCARTVIRANRLAACPDCGSYQLQAAAGGDLKITQLEVD